MRTLFRGLVIGVSVAAVVSVAGQALGPVLGIFGFLLILPTTVIALVIARATRKFRPYISGHVVTTALAAAFLINCAPIPAKSLGARVSFYAELAHYKVALDAECATMDRCNDPSRVTTLITGGFGSIIHGVARDDSGTLLEIIEHHERAPNPLQGCETGIVHLYGSYFHWGCG
jgi:hypothetical protein